MDPVTYGIIKNCVAHMIRAGMIDEALAYWAANVPGVAVPAAADAIIAGGTVVTGEMAAAAATVEEVAAVDAALTLTAVEVDASIAAIAAGGLTEAEWLINMRALQAAAAAGARFGVRIIPQGRALVIILAIGLFALHAASGSPSASAATNAAPKKPDNLTDCMHALYAFYLTKVALMAVASPAKNYRPYPYEEWRVKVFHPILRRLRASAPERQRMRDRARLEWAIRDSQRPMLGKI